MIQPLLLLLRKN
ncbi:unnamed protein product [Callosobruchus maculatus]|uniref:Uncharacterized protein n=1 Tax=Callosobruchus maculatus TaxID=64391 RepID=A0A653CIG2_CALMS|nr:unnamed protein product [Callosobruchus maculatus]